MDTSSNPWAARYESLLDADNIKKLATVEVPALVGLMGMPIELASRTLEQALSTVFFPTTQCIAILQRFAGTAYAHCMATYPDTKAFIAGIYAEEVPLATFFFPICLTGLAGMGKTELIKAFIRIQRPNGTLQVDPSHSPFPLKGAWLVTVQARSAPKDILQTLAGINAKPSDLVKVCRKQAYRDGIPSLLADELQFATGSNSANARVTQMLLSLGYIGIPFVFSANFSLLLRLLKRPEEDQQRLLSNPIILMPDPWTSNDWVETLEAQRSVAPEILKVDPKSDAQTLHVYSGGRKRAMAKLILIAFRAEHPRGGIVDLNALHRAYHSQQFARYREESDILVSQAIRNSPDKRRKDLWCPLPLAGSTAALSSASAFQERGERAAEAELQDALTGQERAAVKEIEKCIKKPRSSTGKVVEIGSRKKATSEDLKRNADWLKGQL